MQRRSIEWNLRWRELSLMQSEEMTRRGRRRFSDRSGLAL